MYVHCSEKNGNCVSPWRKIVSLARIHIKDTPQEDVFFFGCCYFGYCQCFLRNCYPMKSCVTTQNVRSHECQIYKSMIWFVKVKAYDYNNSLSCLCMVLFIILWARQTQKENLPATNVARVQILAWVKCDSSFPCSETGGQFFWSPVFNSPYNYGVHGRNKCKCFDGTWVTRTTTNVQ